MCPLFGGSTVVSACQCLERCTVILGSYLIEIAVDWCDAYSAVWSRTEGHPLGTALTGDFPASKYLSFCSQCHHSEGSYTFCCHAVGKQNSHWSCLNTNVRRISLASPDFNTQHNT